MPSKPAHRRPTQPTDFDAEIGRLRQKRREALMQLHALPLPEQALPGSLALTHSRCRTPNCHCAQGKGHPGWQLTFMVARKKRVERIPAEWAEEVKGRVEAGRAFKDALAELLGVNAELLVLERKQQRLERKQKKSRS